MFTKLLADTDKISAHNDLSGSCISLEIARIEPQLQNFIKYYARVKKSDIILSVFNYGSTHVTIATYSIYTQTECLDNFCTFLADLLFTSEIKGIRKIIKDAFFGKENVSMDDLTVINYSITACLYETQVLVDLKNIEHLKDNSTIYILEGLIF